MECSGFNDGAFILPLFSSGCSIFFLFPLLNIPLSGVWLAVFFSFFFSYYLFPKTFHPFSCSPNVVCTYIGVLKKEQVGLEEENAKGGNSALVEKKTFFLFVRFYG